MATLDQAIQQMMAAGLPSMPAKHPVCDGKIHRFGPKKKAWYVLREVKLKSGVEIIVGAFGIWGQLDAVKVETDAVGISAEERAEFEQRRQELQKAETEKKKRLAEWASNRAQQQWAAASVDGKSAYIERKQITAPGLRYQTDGTVLIPMVVLSADGAKLVGVQKIAPDGAKLFNKGMDKTGACCPIGKVTLEDRVIYLAEGYATGRTIRMATDDSLPGYIGFDAGNLLHVARMARARHPDAHLLFCADDDFSVDQRMRSDLADNYGIDADLPIDGKPHTLAGAKGEYKCTAVRKSAGFEELQYLELQISSGAWSRVIRYDNAGLFKAYSAAAQVGNASVIWPQFSARGENKWTDFNDLHCIEGLDQCKAQLGAAILAALTPISVKERVAAQSAPVPETSNVVKLKPRKKNSKSTAPSASAGEGGINPPPPDGEGVGEAPENAELRWEARLRRDEKGYIKPTLDNVYAILTNNPLWEGVIAYEEFSGQVVKLKPPPYASSDLGEWSDMDDLRTTLWVQQKYGFHPRKDVVMDAVLLAAELQKYHVVRAYLDPLVWDGIERLDVWPIDFLGAADRPAIRRFGRKWLIGAVARVYDPGCKVDNVLILEGSQGLYKSTALKVLGGQWFTDAPFRLGDKDGYIVMRGKWIIELGELDSFNKAESTGAKQFFGQYVDRYRNFYGKRASDVPRQQAFAGTTNSYAYLKDETGNRRYWPIKATEINLAGLKSIRDQLWAEAVAMYRKGEPWWETADDREMFIEEQDARYVGDAYTDKIAEGLIGKAKITISQVMEEILKLDVAKWTKPEQQRIGKSMTELGWIRKRDSQKVGGHRGWHYIKPDSLAEEDQAVSASGGNDGPL